MTTLTRIQSNHSSSIQSSASFTQSSAYPKVFPKTRPDSKLKNCEAEEQQNEEDMDSWFYCPYCQVGFTSSGTLGWHYGYCDQYRRPDSSVSTDLATGE